MARARKHGTDAILDAVRALVLAEGPRAAGIAAIAEVSGAPVGTLYHRFGSRDGVLIEMWLRALRRFQAPYLGAAADPDPIAAGSAMARAVIAFARAHPEDARLLLGVRRRDLLDGPSTDELDAHLAALNAPLEAAARRLARDLHGRATARAVDAVHAAVLDLPYGAVSRHATRGAMPRWLEDDVAERARALLALAR